MTEHDLVIRGTTLIDGTGTPARTADVAVAGEKIAAVGAVPGRGAEEIDAGGLAVMPGWVDIHTHYDGQVTWDPLLTPSFWQGVTTVVMGNCGVGFAPVKPEEHDWLVALMEGVEDIPGTALHEGITWGWETFPEYLEVLDSSSHAIDFAAQVPHGPLRAYVMGERGTDHEEVPTPGEIAEMGRLAAEAIGVGALGFTTTRTVIHRSSDGRYAPSLSATADELLGIARAIATTGAGVFQVVSDLDDVEAEFELFRSMAEAGGRPMSITTLQRHTQDPRQYRRILELLDVAAADGIELRGQVAARPIGLVLTLETADHHHPLVKSPTYSNLASLPLAERVRELRRPEVRATILAELDHGRRDRLRRLGYAFRLGDPPRYDRRPDEALDLAAAYDVLLENEGRGAIFVPIMNYVAGDLTATREMLVHPLTLPGLGDAGAHCSMISDASFPTYLLQFWGMEAPEPDRLPIEWIVKRQAADTAAFVGLADRGRIAPGLRADLNLVDLGALAVRAPEMVYDLPAEGKRLVQRADGYVATFVAGQAVMREGEWTGALPGTLVRGARRAPLGA